MHKIIATSRIPLVAIVVAILTLGLNLMPVGATGAGNATIRVGSGSGQAHVASGVRGVSFADIGGTHNATGCRAYVYADDGQATANTIDEYCATTSGLTSIGTVLTGGTAVEVGFAQNDIAIAKNVSNTACLIHTDSSGLVESFLVNPTTGALTKVSSVPTGDGVNFFPGDVKFSPNGAEAYVDVFSLGAASELVSFPVGTGCVLGTSVTFNATTQQYFSISIPNAHELFTVNTAGATLDVYKIAADGLTLSLATSTPAQLASPDGNATGTVGPTTFTFSGQAVFGPAGTEAHTLSTTNGTLGSVPGSPQFDPSSSNGANVYFALGLVTVTEQFSNSIGSYSRSGAAYAFKNHTAMDPAAQGPLSQTSVSHYLLVINYVSGTVSDCQLSSAGVTSCVQAATLTTNGSGRVPAGIGVVPVL